MNIQGQFLDDFSDSDLNSNPVWEGDVQDFIVNSDEMLQLSAGDGPQSFLFTQVTMPDSIQWNFELKLDFAPSANNKLRIYLAMDQINPDQASGYFIEIGENGSNDALNFYSLTNGTPELLATGELAALSSEPAYLKAAITYFHEGEWTFSTAYSENASLTEEIIVSNSTYDPRGNQIFALECTYTASRNDKFFFDNIGINKFEEDKTGPIITSATLLDAKTIIIQANEKLSETSASVLSNYSIAGYTGNVVSAALTDTETGILLNLSEDLSSGTTYTITVSNITDAKGNVGGNYTFEIFTIDQAAPGDLIVNEILFNPETGGSDFVEILNVSNKFIYLGNLAIYNADRDESKTINSDLTLNPGQYLCLTEDVDYLKDRYQTPDSARFLSTDIPAFNNDQGNVSIIYTIDNTIIDAFDYSEDLHYQQLGDLNGVSLERISPNDDKWFSAAAAVNFASPGYQNSVFLQPNFGNVEVLEFENKTFSPNQDGQDDQLVITYKLPGTGYQVDINIFDQYGRLVRSLVNNELFSEEGFVFWDGLSDAGETLAIGVYFVVFEAYDSSGNVVKSKKPAILADYLD